MSLQDLAFATIHHGEIANPRADDDVDAADDHDDDDYDHDNSSVTERSGSFLK